MDDLPEDLRGFLLQHPFLQLTDAKKVKCTLNGHELPCNLVELQNFTKGKKYEKLSAAAEFNYSQYEPHIVPSSKQPNQLFCKLTLRHLNRLPHHVLRHVNGKRYKKARSKYEECVKLGIAFVPIRLQQKRPKDSGEDVRNQGRSSKHGNSMWEPSSSDDGHSDSEDSMTSMFTLKNPAEESMENDKDVEEEEEEDDDFQTDEDEEMETEEVDKQETQKRKKVQAAVFQKKFRNNNWKCGRSKKQGKVRSGK